MVPIRQRSQYAAPGGSVQHGTRHVLAFLRLVVLPYALLVALLIVLTPTASDATTACGGDGQRGCCGITGEGAPCPGLTEVNGCDGGSCLCGGASNPTSISSNSTCIQTTPCGGKGQRACCGGELVDSVKSCQGDLSEIPGCTGDCYCGGSANPLRISSSGTCTTIETIAEPEIGWTAPTAPAACALRGYADLHVHMFAHLAHGGGTIAGTPYDSVGRINTALEQDYGTDLDLVKKDGNELPAPSCPSYLNGDCGTVLFHGDHTLIDIATGVGTKDEPKSNLGVPAFNGWPTWKSTVHQQVYYKWLERAWRSGLRLMTMFAVTNEALCTATKHLRGTDCTDSMASIDAQLDAAYAFQTWLDAQPGGGWFRIVKSPQEARDVIAQGKLAVVLGIEVDNLFNCHFTNTCTAAFIRQQIDKYYDQGVRHIFPIHNFDNAFGSPAAWQDAINVGNRASEGHWWAEEDCFNKDYGFWLDSFPEFWINLFGFGGFESPIYTNGNLTDYASCNANGLSALGESLIQALMDKGMIIDIDHMSRKSLDRTLTLAEQRNYPVVATHVQFFDLYKQHFAGNRGRHERMRTLAQLQRIKGVGGMIAAMLKDDVQDTDGKGEKDTIDAYGGIVNNCRHSSKAWAQAYKYAVDKMGGPVAFGSDFNGVAGHVGPRFGSDACGGDDTEEFQQLRDGNRVTYPFTLPDFGTFAKQVTGQKTFDFNGDGLAHIGLLPDLVADLKKVGLTDADLDPLFRSAEEYIKVWERSAGPADSGAAAQCVNRTVAANSSCQASALIASDALANDDSVILTQTPPGPYSLGTTSVTLTVTPTQSCDSPSSCTGTVTVQDTTPPPLTCPTVAPVECTGSTTPVTFAAPVVGADNCGTSVFNGCTRGSGSGFSVGSTPVACTAKDASNNAGSCSFTVVVRDTTPPTILCPADITAECVSSGAAVTPGAATGSDICGNVTLSSYPPRTFPFGDTPLTYTATDGVGLTTSCTSTIHVVDTTPPTIQCPAPATIECTSKRSAPFAPAAATASDTCAGVSIQNPAAGTFPLGTTTLNYAVTDAVGLKASCQSSVQVVDTTPPTITKLGAIPNLLWPPNHTMQAVTVSATATDACSITAPTCTITGISSNEPVSGAPDWQITGALTASLRADRSSTGAGRVYTLQVTCTDQQGLSTVGTTTVTVPHDQRS